MSADMLNNSGFVTTDSTINTTDLPDYLADIICLDFEPVSFVYINYATLPMLALIILLSFWVKRKRLWPGCCQRRPGILIPMNLISDTNSRVALSAAFVILTSRLMRLLLEGDQYWTFPGMDDPTFATNYSILRSWIPVGSRLNLKTVFPGVGIPIIKIRWSQDCLIFIMGIPIQLSMCFYPLFACIEHRRYFVFNIVGYLTLVPWFYYTVQAIYQCSLIPIAWKASLYILLVIELPELMADIYLLWFFTKTLYENIVRNRHCCKRSNGSFDFTTDSDNNMKEYVVYVRALLHRKQINLSGMIDTAKESLIYRRIPGLHASARIAITLTVSALGVYSLTWTLFRAVNMLELSFRQMVKNLEKGFNFETDSIISKQEFEDYIYASTYGAYACSFVAMVCEYICLWRIYVNYRATIRQLLRGDKSVYKDLDMTPENMLVYASKYPGCQIAFTLYGYLVTFVVLFIILVVIFTYLFVLPLKWGSTSLVVEVIKNNWQTVAISFVIYYAQVLFAKFVFFDRETGMYDNRRLHCVVDYFLFFFNALLSLFTSFKRIVLSMAFGIIYLSRLDQCGMMRGLERFDNGHKAFLSMLHVEVSQNNPIALCFIEILRQAARGTHRTPSASSQSPLYVVEGGINSATEDVKTDRGHRWAVNKWQKMYTLVNNPSLVIEQLSKNAIENFTTIKTEAQTPV